MAQYELAQLNIALMKGPIDSELMADFVANLDRINALAEASPGYRWRLKTDDGNATALRPFGDEMLVNLSVWRDLQSLRDFVFGPAHLAIMQQRRQWFEKMPQAYTVFWWVPAGSEPSVEEAKAALDHLQANGPTPRAFTFREAFPPPDGALAQPAERIVDECPES